MKMWSLVVVVVLPLVLVAANDDCSVQKMTMKKMRQEWRRVHNEVLTKEFHACELKAYDNQR